ncbi:FRIGIDA-like protein 3 [Magnolia sinica]|uniref:FRIGIDA-like protein 3 n=1 Tax=Magnolia sinica TaxID=86752 RepID=UPI00265ACDA5|nr:FRIGIDA-like protein 3 [Magnolia sinica]
MASLKSISASIQSVPSTKEKLQKAFEALRSHSECLASFNLQWQDLEDHFASIEKSIEQRFKDLESKEQQAAPAAAAAFSSAVELESSDVVPRPKLKSLCANMDGQGLRLFVIAHRKDLQDMREELSAALRTASDPAKMVLESMEGFYPVKSKGDKDVQLAAVRRTCILLLDRLMSISPEISNDVKDRAKKLAEEWEGKVSKNGENPLEGVAFLHLLSAYGLVSSFDVDELLDIVVFIARRKQTIDLCRSLGLTEKIPDLIRKLISNGKQLDAVNYAYAFDVVGEFPPVPLLKAYLKESKKVAQEVWKKGNGSLQAENEAIAKELAALRAIIKCIEEHNLQSEYLPEGLEKRIAQLEKHKAERKRPAPTMPKTQQQQAANKRPRPALVGAAGPTTLTAPLVAQINQQPQHLSSLLADRVSPYLPSAGLYGLAGPGAGASALYDRQGPSYLGSHLGYVGGRSPPMSHIYSTELSSSLYDKPVGYSGYTASGGMQHGSLQQPYHQSYYP